MRSSIGGSRWSALLLGGLLLVLSQGTLAESKVTPGSKAAGLNACVAPTEEIRRSHMVNLKHDRVETVRNGNRDVTYSLAGCIDCHAAKDDKGNYQPVDAEGQFCSTCHSYVAVEPPCFQCHSATPDQKQSALSRADTTKGLALELLKGKGGSVSDQALFKQLHAYLQEK